MKRVGFWLSEKKRKKLDFAHFATLCGNVGIELVQIDLSISLESQGPFDVILHKLTDMLAQANEGDTKARNMIKNLEDYVNSRQNVRLIDPLQSVSRLLDRSSAYTVIQDCIQDQEATGREPEVVTPTFAEIYSKESSKIANFLKKADVQFPFVCKVLQAHGSSLSHKMAIIFNEEGLSDIRPPCVAQTFINHNAVLYKIFIVGDLYFTVVRPSVKNFSPGVSDISTIFFDSQDVSKANSSSFLNELDASDQDLEGQRPSPDKIRWLVKSLREKLSMALLGVDLIVENFTGTHYVIDINVFPSYDGVPPFFQALVFHLQKLVGRNGTQKFPPLFGGNGEAAAGATYIRSLSGTCNDFSAKRESNPSSPLTSSSNSSSSTVCA